MSEASNTFVRADDETLIKVIERARQRLVFIAPGVRKKVATALASAMDVVPSDAIHLVVDVDSEVCRLGYTPKPIVTRLLSVGDENGVENGEFGVGAELPDIDQLNP